MAKKPNVFLKRYYLYDSVTGGVVVTVDGKPRIHSSLERAQMAALKYQIVKEVIFSGFIKL